MIKKLSISGFRGFGLTQTINFSLPDAKNEGSGFNVIVGPNNSGKTSIIEAIRAFNDNESPSFSEGKRNLKVNQRVKLELVDEKDFEYIISTIESGGSNTNYSKKIDRKILTLQSRRYINYEFGKHEAARDQYITLYNSKTISRSAQLEGFFSRLFNILRNKEKFDEMLKSILGESIEWTIEQMDNNNYYLKYTFDGVTHSSEGIGDGIWSVFTICDAIYDAKIGDTVIIDEPELSVHPAIQKKIADLFIKESREKQIIVCTHSPYYINWNSIASGGGLIRIIKTKDVGITCYSLTDDLRGKLKGLLQDYRNPHILGFESKEAFFLNDKIILVEGQEDVLIYKKISEHLNSNIKGEFYGWGVGGAQKMEFFLSLFRELGYKKVIGLLDGDQTELFEKMKFEFKDYKFLILSTEDIRDKDFITSKEKKGVTNSSGKLKDEFVDEMKILFNDLNSYLT